MEPMKEPYVKEIDPDLHSLQAEVGGDIGATYPYSDPVALVCIKCQDRMYKKYYIKMYS